MIRILLAEDEDLTRGALAALLDLEPDLTVTAQACDGPAAVRAAADHPVDIALLDLEMPHLDGVGAAQAIRRRHPVPVVLVTRHARPGVLRRALAAGIQGFVPKTTPATRLADILRDVHGGGRYIDHRLATHALTETPCPLTPRELDVLRAVHRGQPISALAEQHHLAPGTVRNYLSGAITKLAVRTRHEAARRAWEEGWI
ncbi:DNA-binding response regulator [Kitasatospora xanthocidica]|uniref:DNA-binding response regulator n=1 Tax=Kitasatospora xanthocidica TaxID=83382 RepID=A0A372ZL87_9ACTN|nr:MULTISPECIES: response regulator transcription factor [Streptomycetaceae]OKI00456.1 LuxR family transcriptional regulator [Streptomyces sp. CB02056]RGD56606.1 DNA-binding response regulator [Kitasatospora xanthocidica]